MGQLLSAASPSAQIAQIINATMGSLLASFAGFSISPSNIPEFWKVGQHRLSLASYERNCPTHTSPKQREGRNTRMLKPEDLRVRALGQFLYWALPSHYALEGMVVTQWVKSKATVAFLDPSTGFKVVVPAWSFLDNYFGGDFKWENRWINVGIMVGYTAAMVVLVSLALRYAPIGVR
jgi:hypothetical protein